jgi:hypothetical protein
VNEVGGSYSTDRGTGGYKLLVRNSEEGSPRGRPAPRWEDNINMVFQEVGWGLGCIDLAQYRDRRRAVVNAVMNLRVP